MFLELAGTTIPVRMEPVEADVRRFGDATEAYDGTALTRRRATKREWQCETPWLDVSTAATVLAVLEGTPPTAATGDLTGSINVLVTRTSERKSTFAGSERRISYSFTLREV